MSDVVGIYLWAPKVLYMDRVKYLYHVYFIYVVCGSKEIFLSVLSQFHFVLCRHSSGYTVNTVGISPKLRLIKVIYFFYF